MEEAEDEPDGDGDANKIAANVCSRREDMKCEGRDEGILRRSSK